MKKPAKVPVASFLFAILGLTAWVVLDRSQPTLAGKSQSFWIKSLAQTNLTPNDGRWRAFGPEAVPGLINALPKHPGPFARAYSRLQPRLPVFACSLLPSRTTSSQILLKAAALLADQESGSKNPLEPLGRALNDPHFGVRMN